MNVKKNDNKKSSLVIVYHRQPYEEVEIDGRVEYRENKSPNGIVPTLKSFFGSVDKGTWVAWKKHDAEGAPEWEPRVTFDDQYGSYDVCRIPLTSEEVSSFYHVTSKEALWPILHSFPWHFDVSNTDWATFREVNRRFAEAACEQAADDALIWVHDYNLWLVPHFVRKLKPHARIAFFHHTPFPAADIFNILPWREEIVESLLTCDLIGFHIPRYVNNFVQVARSISGVRTEERIPAPRGLAGHGLALGTDDMVPAVRHNGRRVQLDACPVGTNPTLIRELLATEAGRDRVTEIREDLGDSKLIVSIGRVDYSKGTREMLETYERLLERRPELRGHVRLLVTSVSAAAGMSVYDETRHDIEHLVGRINGRFSSLTWAPIRLLTSTLPFDEVVACYAAADICWTTPLRDGLNLVAKEFIAAHEGREGALVLSEFTGVSAELTSAILVNPYSRRSMDEAIDEALAMEPSEQRARVTAMAKKVSDYDIEHWAEHVMKRFAALRPQPIRVPEPDAEPELTAAAG